MNITYKIKEGTEDVILKSGHEVEFNLTDVKPHVEKMRSTQKELLSQIDLEAAKQRNVEDHHPVVSGLTDEEMAAVSIYYASKGIQKKSEEKLKEITELLQGYESELKEIKAQTGLVV